MSKRNSHEAKARRRAERARQRDQLDARVPGLADFIFGTALDAQDAPDDGCMWADGCARDWYWEFDMRDGLSTLMCEAHGLEFMRLNEDGIAAGRSRWTVGE